MRYCLLILLCACGRLGFGSTNRTDSGDAQGAADASLDGTTALVPDVMTDASLAAMAQVYWKFDEGAGGTSADSAGTNPITLFNGALWSVGVAGAAILADGTNDYLRSSATVDLSATPAATVSIWSKRAYTSGPRHTLFELTTDFNSFTTGFGLFPDDNTTCTGGEILVALKGNVGNSYHCYTQPSSNVWHHFVAVYDKSKLGVAEIELYVDGTLAVATSTPSISENTNLFANASFFVFTRGGTSEFNPGQVDEIAIFSRALSAAEIAQL